jgi:hypothetical protein
MKWLPHQTPLSAVSKGREKGDFNKKLNVRQMHSVWKPG